VYEDFSQFSPFWYFCRVSLLRAPPLVLIARHDFLTVFLFVKIEYCRDIAPTYLSNWHFLSQSFFQTKSSLFPPALILPQVNPIRVWFYNFHHGNFCRVPQFIQTLTFSTNSLSIDLDLFPFGVCLPACFCQFASTW